MADRVEKDKYIVRLPDGMRDQLKEKAEANSRTLNSEIVARLQLTLRHDALDAIVDRVRQADAKGQSRSGQVRPEADNQRGVGHRVTIPAELSDDDVAAIFAESSRRAVREAIATIVGKGGKVEMLDPAGPATSAPGVPPAQPRKRAKSVKSRK